MHTNPPPLYPSCTPEQLNQLIKTIFSEIYPESENRLKEAIKEAIDDALDRYGIDTDNHKSMQADLVYLRKARIGSEEIIKWGRRSAITVAVSGIFATLWQGVKHIINNN